MMDTPTTNRRAAIGRALRKREQVSADPAFLSLTDDEQQNGLALFSGEEGPPLERQQTFERVPTQVDPRAPADRTIGHAIPLPQDPDSPMTWQAPLLAGMLVAIVVVFGVVAVRIMHNTPDDRFARSSHPAVAHVAAVPDVPGTTAAAVTTVAEVAPPPETMAQAVVTPETPAVRASARPVPPLPSERQSQPIINAEPPIRAAVLSRPVAAEPQPVPEFAIVMRDVAELPDSRAVESRPVPAVPATLPREESGLAPAPLPAPETAIQSVLSRYRSAYRSLDAGAAHAIWPKVDTKALRKAFDRLEQQDLVFDSCAISVGGARAVASCVGLASYVPRAGNRDRHDDQRQWEFTLSKVEDAWLIDSVSTR